jgi:16S rRNA (guanine(966)-N(2))-methyltransferase RsmD
VRETLFNWLAPVIEGAQCLDCFAGSGALAFEALSRGAVHCVLLERDAALANRLSTEAARLGAVGAEIHCVDARAWLRGNPRRFDIIFVDPPFASDLAAETCALIANGRNLTRGGFVYVETAPGWKPPAGRFAVRKRGRAGRVQYLLLAVETGGTA